ncbi:MAG: hypothetical protein WC714_28545 [Candidatus Obscuribacterales bacterium]|jgi:hypothetical protein
MPELVDVSYLMNEIKRSRSIARRLLNQQLEPANGDLKKGTMALYKKADVDQIVHEFINGRDSIKPNEWTRWDIAEHFNCHLSTVNRLVYKDGFPKVKRHFIPNVGRRNTAVWDSDAVKEINLIEFMNHDGINKINKEKPRNPLTWTQKGTVGLMLKFIMGEFDRADKKRRYEYRRLIAKHSESKTITVRIDGVWNG